MHLVLSPQSCIVAEFIEMRAASVLIIVDYLKLQARSQFPQRG